MPGEELPLARSKPFFDLLDSTLSDELTRQIGRPFWIDTVGRSNFVDIRIKLDDAVMHVLARRSQTYASNSQIFLLWMVGTSLVLFTVAILFLRNQIKPILRLSEAAESFGKGRPPPEDFRPRGAREVRQAAHAFIEMRDRIERHVEQRTVMLAGVSHDLRTVLTRFKLQLALFEDTPELEAMRADVDEMQAMLEDYMAFAKGDSGEEIVRADIGEILNEVKSQAHGTKDIAHRGQGGAAGRSGPPPCLQARGRQSRQQRGALRRACRMSAPPSTNGALTVAVEDDGPGIPEAEREHVFRPFYRLDHARNQDSGSTGLGLAIARDIARIHGGDIALEPIPARRIEGRAKSPGLSMGREPLGGAISCDAWWLELQRRWPCPLLDPPWRKT